MCGSDENNSQVHSEVENLEDLRLGKGQHHYSTKFGQGDAGQDLKTEKGSLL